MWKAFAELEELGWIGSARPRMVSVQASGCAPIVKAFHENKSTAELWGKAANHRLRFARAASGRGFFDITNDPREPRYGNERQRRRDACGNSAGWKSRRHFFLSRRRGLRGSAAPSGRKQLDPAERRGAYSQHCKRSQIYRSHPPTFPTEFANEKLAQDSLITNVAKRLS